MSSKSAVKDSGKPCRDAVHSASKTTSGPCDLCNRPRCIAPVGTSDRRCANSPVKDAPYCASHGDVKQLRTGAMKRRILEETENSTKKFWDPDAPRITDVGEFMLGLLSSMANTYDMLSQRMDDRVRAYDEAMERWNEQAREECLCCGHDPRWDKEPADPFDSPNLRVWQFVLREMSTLSSNIERLGLLERQVKVQESTAIIIGRALQAALESAGIDEPTQMIVRGHVIDELRQLES